MSHLFRRWLVGACGLLMLFALSGCGAPAQGSGPITATMTEYAFQLSRSTATAGPVTFRITNNGTITHEFVVIQTDLSADALPRNSQGDVDEEKLKSMGEQGDIEPGKTVDLTLDMHPGNYMIICNLPGHFQKGMHTTFTVSS